jgi:ABC-type multidrug transport system fused ATPase/permease subunit
MPKLSPDSYSPAKAYSFLTPIGHVPSLTKSSAVQPFADQTVASPVEIAPDRTSFSPSPGLSLQQRLQRIQALNAALYDQVFAAHRLSPLLNGNGQEWRATVVHYMDAIHAFYDEQKLRQLSPVACEIRQAEWRLRKIRWACRGAAGLSLIVSVLLLQWVSWPWALGVLLLVVGPLLMVRSLQRRMRQLARQTVNAHKQQLRQISQTLNAQEAQIVALLSNSTMS